ncbi:MAG TPA: hypothetical protein VF954_02995 [Acidimicrobiales bacterium]
MTPEGTPEGRPAHGREAETEAEIERQAAREPDDPTTGREELELELLEEHESEQGGEIGEHLG